MSEFTLGPVTLTGEHVRLEPLGSDHVPGLLEAARDEEIWRFLPIEQPATPAEMETFVGEALELQEQGDSFPFATLESKGNRVAGSTRYLDIKPAHRGVEIGFTWLGREFQRSAINTESKLLLLQHAFEAHGAVRVQLKTDLRNVGSQRAIERIGAKREGVLRNHMIVKNGFVRDSVFYSITAAEWPAVKQELRRKLGRNR